MSEAPAATGPALVPDQVTAADLPTDDWPFIYLPRHGIPTAYLWVVVCLVLASIVVLKRRGLHLGKFSRYHAHLFFLGAAFLLMEVHAINRLALLFGTVWLVSAVTIAIVLLLIVCANLTQAVKRVPYTLAYGALALSLAISYWIEPTAILGQGSGLALGFALVLLSPVYFAGLVFARSFQLAQVAAPAIGVNILGAVLGGWMEYSTMAFGMRNLVLLAAGLYLLSLLALLSAKRRGSWPAIQTGTGGGESAEFPEETVQETRAPDAGQPEEVVPDPATVA